MGVSIKKKIAIDKEQKKNGRPDAGINKDQFEQMCRIHCTLREIAGVFQCCQETVERWVKKTYHSGFVDVWTDFASQGKMSLRREMFKKALGGNGSMQIWLSKNHLGMKDRIETDMSDDSKEVIKLAYALPNEDK
jgi:hypothetical protein